MSNLSNPTAISIGSVRRPNTNAPNAGNSGISILPITPISGIGIGGRSGPAIASKGKAGNSIAFAGSFGTSNMLPGKPSTTSSMGIKGAIEPNASLSIKLHMPNGSYPSPSGGGSGHSKGIHAAAMATAGATSSAGSGILTPYNSFPTLLRAFSKSA